MTISVAPLETLVRLWDSDWNLCHVLNPGDVDVTGDTRTLAYPADHVVSRWIETLTGPPTYGTAHLTIDTPAGRWFAHLTSWRLRKAGECPHCEHCQQTLLVSQWTADEPPTNGLP